jgi:hypothetical protein
VLVVRKRSGVRRQRRKRFKRLSRGLGLCHAGGNVQLAYKYGYGISLVRRNNEWHHFDPLGTAQVITNSSASVIRDNLCGGLPHRWWSRVFAVYYIASPLHERVRFRTGEQVDRWL